MRHPRLLVVLAGVLLLQLAACAGAGRGVLHPPPVRLQELAVGEDGGLALALRAMNNAARGARFERLELELSFAGSEPVRLREAGVRELPPRSVEIYRFVFASGEVACAPALAERPALFWRLDGRIVVEGRTFPVTVEGRLDPVPGRPGLFR